MIKRILLITISIVFLISCSFKPERDPNILVWSISSDPAILNPILSADAASSIVLSYVYESLLDMDRDTLEVRPFLAKSWEVSENHLEYTFIIRDNVFWHDGKPFTVDDVIFSYNKLMDPKVAAGSLRSYFSDVQTVEKIDNQTVKFIYKKKYFKALEICGALPIVPKHIFDDDNDFNTHPFNRKPIGTGPFVFKKWVTGSKVVLEKNKNYWGRKPKIDGIVYKVIPNSTVALQLLKKENIDLAELSSIQWEKQTESKNFNEKFNKFRYWLPNYYFITWNMRRPLFQDKRVRLALTMHLNRKEIVDKLLFGQGELISGPFYKFGPYYDKSNEIYAYNPKKSKKLLEEAGWKDTNNDGILDKDGKNFSFELLFSSGDRANANIGLILKEDLSKIGIEVKLNQLEWATLLKSVSARDFDALSVGLVGGINLDPYQVWHSSQSEKGTNLFGFKNKQVDELIEKGRLEFDQNKRAILYKKIHKIIHEEQPATFLFTKPSLVAVSKRFSDVKAHQTGIDILEWGIDPWHTLVEW